MINGGVGSGSRIEKQKATVAIAAIVTAGLVLAGCGPDQPAASGHPAIDALVLSPKDVDVITHSAATKTKDNADYAAAAADYAKDQQTAPTSDSSALQPAACAVLVGTGSAKVFGSDYTAYRKRQIDKGERQNTSSYEAVALYPAPVTTALATITSALRTCQGATITTTGAPGETYLVDNVHLDTNSAEWTFHDRNPNIVDRQWNCAIRVVGDAVIEIELADGDAAAVAAAVAQRIPA
ncbi:hypothetical protein [Nocardia sp. NPDC005825]|uniref:hypothetical protein n=1 Tax=unclassified Nocardia TaxID=2637762 RepID=UPI0033D07A45